MGQMGKRLTAEVARFGPASARPGTARPENGQRLAGYVGLSESKNIRYGVLCTSSMGISYPITALGTAVINCCKIELTFGEPGVSEGASQSAFKSPTFADKNTHRTRDQRLKRCQPN